MALATRCPACSTVFRISTAQAAAKGGMVRCGQCRNVFNSLDALVRVEDLDILDETIVESRPPSASGSSAPSAPPSDPSISPPAELSSATSSASSSASSSAPSSEPAALPEEPSAPAGTPSAEAGSTSASQLDDADASPSEHPLEALETVHARFAPDPVPVAPSETGAVVDDAVVDDAVVREWWVPEQDDAFAWTSDSGSGSSALAEPLAAETASPVVDLRDDAGRMLSGGRGDPNAAGPALAGMDPLFLQGEPRPALSRTARIAFGFLSVIAIVGLVAQSALLWRDELAARWPPARPWLAAVCQPLHCKVEHPTHLDAITIESTSIQTSGAASGTYLLTALLRNRAVIDVRYPYLELVLTDVQDRPILRRALRPEDYLAPPRETNRSPDAGFAAESELPIRLTFDLADLRFAGYRLDKFYP